MGRHLTMYDLSGIQGFIFQTNRLKEIAGASFLVSKALFSNVPELAGEEPDAWKTREPDGFAYLEPGEAKTVYVGGGNALVLFGDGETAVDFTRRLKRRVFEQTGGAIRICSASVEIGDGTRLADCLDFGNPDGLRARLDRSKSKAPQALPARGFSIDRLDNESFEPAIYFEDAVIDRGRLRRILPRSRKLKLEEYARQHGPEAKRGYTSPLLELHEGREFEVEFDGFFQGGETGRAGKRFLAVVHIDGNTMGQRIASFLKASGSREQSFEQDLADMRDMSACIGDSYRDALGQMIDTVYAEFGGTGLPFRPVVADGDDITFICRSEAAFECFRVFVEVLRRPNGPAPEVDGLPKPSDFSVGAGIAFVNSSYPFSSAYEMAEELCKNAKKATLARMGSEIEPVIGEGGPTPVSSVDFHVCSGELVSDIGGYRKRYLVQRDADGGEVSLCMRPYHLGIERPGDGMADFSLGGFMKLLGELQLRSAETRDTDRWIARSKLKGMRDKYGEGRTQAELYGHTIMERDLALLRSGASGGAERTDFVSMFAEPYVQCLAHDGVEGHWYAKLFDALDTIDLCDGKGAPRAVATQGEGGRP